MIAGAGSMFGVWRTTRHEERTARVNADTETVRITGEVEVKREQLVDDRIAQHFERLEAAPDSSQRDLSRWLGVSLGKLNACLRCLIEEGLVVANAPSDNGGLSGPRYRVTRRGRASRAESAVRCLKEKQALVSTLKSEIASLEAELNPGDGAGGVREG